MSRGGVRQNRRRLYMGLLLQPSRRISGKIVTLIAAFALIAQPMYGLVGGMAKATPVPFGVDVTCENSKAILTLTTRQTDLPNIPQDARNWHAKVIYKTNEYGLNTQTLSESDVDTWTIATDEYSIDALNVSATVTGGYTIREEKTVPFFGKVTYDRPHVYYKDLTVTSEAKVCDTTKPTVNASLSKNTISPTDNSNPFVTVNAVDAESGLREIQYKITPKGDTNNNVVGWIEIANGATTEVTGANTLPDGHYTIRVRAIDNVGNKSSDNDIDFVVDRVAPTISSVILKDSNAKDIADEGYINTVDNRFTFTLDSADTDVARYNIRYWNDITDDMYQGESKAWPTYVDVSGIYHDKFSRGEGIHYFSFNTCDNFGNCSDFSEKFTVTYDKTAPNIKLVSPADEAIVKGASLTNEWKSDSEDVDYYIYESWHDEGRTNLRWREDFSTDTTRKTATNVKDTTFWWQVTAVDKAGNKTTSPLWKITVDNIDPTVELSNNHTGFVSEHDSWKDARKIEVKIGDNNIGTTKLYSDDDETEITSYERDTFSVGRGLAEGVYYFVHTDKAGNKSAKKYFTISNKKPSIYDVEGLITDETTVAGPEDVVIEFKAGNSESLAAVVDQVMIRGWVYDESKKNNRGAAAFKDQIVGTSAGKFNSNLTTLLGDKYIHGAKFVIMLQARNTANVHDQHVFALEVDLQAPNIDITSADRFTTNRPVISGTVGSDAETVEISIDGDEKWVPATAHNPVAGTWSYTYTTDLSNASHTIQVRATDKAGNVGDSTSKQGFATATFEVNVPITETRPISSVFPTPPTTPASAIPAIPGIFSPAIITLPATDESAGTVESATDIRSKEARRETNSTKANGEVLAAENSKQNWSIVNLLLAVGVVLASIIALLGIGRKENRRVALRVLSVVPAIGAVALLLSVENFSEPIAIVNSWSWLMAVIALVQIVIVTLARKTPSSIE